MSVQVPSMHVWQSGSQTTGVVYWQEPSAVQVPGLHLLDSSQMAPAGRSG
jgi:hypothetical protein